MAEEVKKAETNAKEKAVDKTEKKKKNLFKSLKGEFKKISWPGKDTLTKETIVVVICTAVLSGLISLIDACIKLGIGFIAGLGA